MNLVSKVLYFYKRKIEPGFKVGRRDKVIDIGSGDKPFWRGDVFFDDLELGNNQRASDKGTITNFGKFVSGHLPKTPFMDKEFDFSFCAHVLEHVEDPAAAIQELMRISKRGYIEVPNGVQDTIAPFHSHLWLVFLEGNTLVFLRKSKRLHEVMLKNGLAYKYLISRMKNPFIRIYWEDKISFEVINPFLREDMFEAVEADQPARASHGLYIYVADLLRKLFYYGQ